MSYRFDIRNLSYKNLNIRNKLVFVYSLLIMFSIISISNFTYYYSKKIMIDKSINYTRGILEEIDYSINTNMEHIDLASYNILSNYDIHSILQYGKSNLIYSDPVERTDVNRILINVMFSRRDIESIYLFNNSGTIFGTNGVYDGIPYEKLKEIAKFGDGKFIYLDVSENKKVLPAVRVVNNFNMTPVGLLLVNIKLSSFQNVFSRQISKMNGKIYLLNNDHIIASLDEDTIGVDFSTLPDSNIKYKKDYYYSIIDGKENIVISYPSKFSEWKYMSVIPMEELIKEVSNQRKFNNFATAIFILILIFITFVVAKTITEPINRVTKKMEKLRLGDSSDRIEYDGKDEISYLSDAFNEMVERNNTLVKEVYEEKLIRSEQEFKALQAQINPHFLYNTLDIINWMARVKGINEIGSITKALSNMLRYSINNQVDVVTIEDEISHINNYLTIQRIRCGDRLKVFYNIDNDILGLSILKLTLQPIVENCLTHGFNHRSGSGTITVKGSILEEKVCIQVIDDGIGVEEEKINSILNSEKNKIRNSSDYHCGIGITNVNSRIKYKFGKDYGVKIKSRYNEGTTVEVWLPCK